MSEEEKELTPAQAVEQEQLKDNSQEEYTGNGRLNATPGGQHSVRSSSLINSSKMMSTGVSAFGASTAQTDMMKAMIH